MAPLCKLIFALTTLTSLATAFAVPRAAASSTPTLPLKVVNPQNTGTSSLPAPTGTPTVVAIGVGFQNYTCNATSSTSGSYVQTAESDGALARLYNLTQVLTTKNINNMTGTALVTFEACLANKSANANDTTNCHLSAVDSISNGKPHPRIGTHFFSPVSGTQVPHFALDSSGLFLSAKKVGTVAAPSTAYKGEYKDGAVPWLYLVNDGECYTKGLQSVYRVETAGGGAPPSCSSSDSGKALSVPYAAQYWFYS